ncbi:MAG: Uma2 family endonuclease [Acidobacteria bacterium]|jgi:Uma2 family endonuclease|nr:Uma2 family endonuclease [Acidobacteriota bacterium]
MELVLDFPKVEPRIKQPPVEKERTVERVYLQDVSWETYRQIVEDQMGKRSLRLTYDDGDLEIMVVSYKHENYSFTLGEIVSTISDWLELDFVAAGSTTFRGEKKKKGFEGDGSFYFKNAQVIRGKSEIDLNIDPSPELVIEVDITHGSLSKFSILAAVGVEEIWRFDGEGMKFYRLQGENYEEVTESVCLRGVKSETVTELLFAAEEMKRSEWLKLVHKLIGKN